MLEGNVLAALGTVGAAIWAYGSAGEERRANFRAWLAGRRSAVAPVARRIFWGCLVAIAAIGAGAVTIGSVDSIASFLVSSSPIARSEVFNLILSCINAFSYSIFCVVCTALVLQVARPQRKLEQAGLLLTEQSDEYIELRLDSEACIDEMLSQLRETGITIHLAAVARGKARLEVKAPAQISLSIRRALQEDAIS